MFWVRVFCSSLMQYVLMWTGGSLREAFAAPGNPLSKEGTGATYARKETAKVGMRSWGRGTAPRVSRAACQITTLIWEFPKTVGTLI